MIEDIRDFDQENDVINITTYIPSKHGRGYSVPVAFLNNHSTIFPKELKNYVCEALNKGGIRHLWLDEPNSYGLPCRVMRNGKPWQKGKIVISLNFIPDPPDEIVNTEELNELDQLRQQ